MNGRVSPGLACRTANRPADAAGRMNVLSARLGQRPTSRQGAWPPLPLSRYGGPARQACRRGGPKLLRGLVGRSSMIIVRRPMGHRTTPGRLGLRPLTSRLGVVQGIALATVLLGHIPNSRSPNANRHDRDAVPAGDWKAVSGPASLACKCPGLLQGRRPNCLKFSSSVVNIRGRRHQ